MREAVKRVGVMGAGGGELFQIARGREEDETYMYI